MGKNVTPIIGKNLVNMLSLVEADIRNCPDSLWVKKYGGDFYWQQIYHLLTSKFGMLQSENTTQLDTHIPLEIGFMRGDATFTGEHSKEYMLQVLEQTRRHLTTYFQDLDDNRLFNEVDFFGNTITVLDLLMIATSHIMYHVGVCDAALRDHGAKPAL